MVRICRLREIGAMTGVTVGVLELVIPVDMALRTGQRGVGSRKLERRGGMAECRRLPGSRAVALRAHMAKVALDMIRINRLGEGSCMAAVAVRELQLIVTVHVTLRTSQSLVRSCQGKSR